MISESPITLCKDCKWAKVNWFYGWKCAKCHNPKSTQFKVNVVSGDYESGYCSLERLPYVDSCGPDAKYFEPKNTKQQVKKQYERFKLWWK